MNLNELFALLIQALFPHSINEQNDTLRQYKKPHQIKCADTLLIVVCTGGSRMTSCDNGLLGLNGVFLSCTKIKDTNW